VTITGTEAYETIRTHHQMLSAHVAAVSEAVTAGRPHETAGARLVAYLAGEILPHAAAEEETIYPAAAARPDLAGTVSAMTAEHKTLSAAAGRLAGLPGGVAAAGQARQIAEPFAEHAARENDILLPALLADHDVDLAALLAEMHRRTGEAGKAAHDGDAPAGDSQAAVLLLLLQAATALARAGQANRACRLASSAWAALREPRPDLAVRVTAALHGLTRGLTRGPDGEPAQAGAPGGDPEPGAGFGSRPGDPDLDVRDLPPAQRHESISRPTRRSGRARPSCWSMTMTQSRCGTSSRPSTPGSSSGSPWRPDRRPGGCASAALPRESMSSAGRHAGSGARRWPAGGGGGLHAR
jgi:hypothetical protein